MAVMLRVVSRLATRSAMVVVGLAVFLPALSVTATADAVPLAPPLTANQLQQLRGVKGWVVQVDKVETVQGTGGGAGVGNVSSWTASDSESYTTGGTYVVSGPTGCPGSFGVSGCPIDYSGANGVNDQATASEQVQSFADFTISTGCPSPDGSNSNGGSISVSVSATGNGSLALDGSPGHQVRSYVKGFFIDYSTNPPTAGSDVATDSVGPVTNTRSNSNCGNSTSQTSSGVFGGLAGDLSFYFANPTDYDAGGDTQVRVENGQFVVSGSEQQTAPQRVCGSPLGCGDPNSPYWYWATYHESMSWVARSETALDTTPPVVTVPASPLVAEATGPSGALVNFSATANDPDNGVVPVSCNPPSGSTFAVGSTTVACTATDPAGNVGTGTFTVVVQDTTPPTITVPKTMKVNATSPEGAQVLYAVTAVDLVDGVVPVSCFPPSGTIFPIGTTTVDCTASDSHGNASDQSFDIQVKGAASQLADLLKLVTQNQLGPGSSLADKLQTAQAAVAANDTAGACGALQAFINEAQAQSGKKLTVDQATALVADAQRIMAILSC